MFYHTLFCSAL